MKEEAGEAEEEEEEEAPADGQLSVLETLSALQRGPWRLLRLVGATFQRVEAVPCIS